MRNSVKRNPNLIAVTTCFGMPTQNRNPNCYYKAIYNKANNVYLDNCASYNVYPKVTWHN